MSLQVDLRGFERGLVDLLAGMRNGAHQALKSAVKAAEESAATTEWFKDGPEAKLRRSIKSGVPEPFKGFLRAGGPGIKEAIFIENGTPPHVIKPKRKRGMLRFEVNGEVMFRKIVHHPGTAARPFMARAAAVGEQTLDYGLEVFTERPIAKFNAG